MIDTSFCDEFYTVEKTVEVVVKLGGTNEFIRIEALCDRSGKYDTRSYILREIKVALAYSKLESGVIMTNIWCDYDLPMTDRDTAEGVIDQALAFLSERVAT